MLERKEMAEILEEIARNSKSSVARIQAIKTLKVMEKDQNAGLPVSSPFDELYDDELATKRRGKLARESRDQP